MNDDNTTRKRLLEEQVSIEKGKKENTHNKIQKTEQKEQIKEEAKTSKLTHEEIHERVMIALSYPEIREMYEKQGLADYDTLYKLKSKLQPCGVSLEMVNGRLQYIVYDERENIMDPEDEDVKAYIENYRYD